MGGNQGSLGTFAHQGEDYASADGGPGGAAPSHHHVRSVGMGGGGQEPNGSCPRGLTSCRGQAGVQGTNRTVGVSL